MVPSQLRTVQGVDSLRDGISDAGGTHHCSHSNCVLQRFGLACKDFGPSSSVGHTTDPTTPLPVTGPHHLWVRCSAFGVLCHLSGTRVGQDSWGGKSHSEGKGMMGLL